MKPKFFLTMAVVCSVAAVAGTATAGPKKHRKVQNPPIKLGTTGGNANDLINDGLKPPCGSHTLGALVQKGSTQYILSSGFNLSRLNKGKKGEEVIQPGLNFTKGGKCNADHPKNNTVAELTKFNKLKFKAGKNNKMDAALAEVRPGMVDPNGDVLGIGTPGGHVIPPFLGQRVKKSGSGTGVRVGTVVAVKTAAVVAYGRPFGSPPLANFVKHFIVQSTNNKALVGNTDSGSVFFENRTSCPGWVGLLIGISADRMFALATPINTVLNQLKNLKPKGAVKPVGCSTTTAAVGEPQSRQLQQAMREAERIQEQVESEVMRLPGVVGMGLGIAKDNPEEVVIKIFVEDDTEAIRENIPGRLGKVRCEIVATGRFYAM